MTKAARTIQLFIHRYYNAIKLMMLFIILSLVGLGIMYQFESNARSSEERGKAVLSITQSIKSETEKQTKTINRQLQALCYLIVQTSGEEALRNLDPPLEEQCRDLASDLKDTDQVKNQALPTPKDTQQPHQGPIIAPQTDAPKPEANEDQVGLVLGLTQTVNNSITNIKNLLGGILDVF